MFTRIDHTAFIVLDADASRDFYCRLLGFTVEREIESPAPHLRKICFIRLGETRLELLQLARTPGENTPGISGSHICLATNDFDADVQTLVQAGIKALQPPVTIGNRHRASFAGPDGEEIEIVG